MTTGTAKFRNVRADRGADPAGRTVHEAIVTARRHRRRRYLHVRAAQLLLVALALAAWQGAAMVWLDPFFSVTPSSIWQRLVDWATNGTPTGSLCSQIATTVAEAGIGFVPGAALAVALGVAIGRGDRAGAVLGPIVRAANAAPRVALAALFVVWFGLGPGSKIVTVVVTVFFAVFADTFDGVRAVEQDKLDQAYLFGADRAWALRHVVLPVAGPRIVRSLQAGFGWALTGAIVGEFIGSDRGVGALIHNAQATFDATGVCAGTIVATSIALLAQWMLAILDRAIPRATDNRAR
jgi:NitT/TauT family transport system permease protein